MQSLGPGVRILGIETSCDETGVAIYDDERGLLAQALHSQVEIHAAYGGVVPELASRDHVRRLTPLVRQVMAESGSSPSDVSAVAYTVGPGLVGALLVGAAFGRSLAYAWGVKALPIHHMEGHLLTPLLANPRPAFPFVALLVSGGHTQLVEVAGVGRYRTLGQSLDDAAGEAFDKTAKLLRLGYPGGPAIAALARGGDPQRFRFPRPMTNRPGLDFSFSGLKTYTMNTVRRHGGENADDQLRADVARAFEDAVVDTLRIKCERALRQTRVRSLVVAGGVGANLRLRETLRAAASTLGATAYFPPLSLCTDNGAMIAYAGFCRLRSAAFDSFDFGVRARWPIDELCPPEAQ